MVMVCVAMGRVRVTVLPNAKAILGAQSRTAGKNSIDAKGTHGQEQQRMDPQGDGPAQERQCPGCHRADQGGPHRRRPQAPAGRLAGPVPAPLQSWQQTAAGQRRFGLIAHRLHRLGSDSALAQWARSSEDLVRQLGLQLVTVGAAFDALLNEELLVDYPGLHRLPNGREGGLMRVVSRIAGGLTPGEALDGVIFLMDPVDPSSTFPEAQALKRQCVTHGKPFVPTLAGALEWILVEALGAGLAPGRLGSVAVAELDPADQTLALIAHDARKSQMVDFAGQHFDLLSRFESRVATGTTGGLLNELAWSRGWPVGQAWVTRYQSGPLGGDAQIAELVLDGACQKVIFFEDPHVARQHEADIQLMERAVWSAGARCSCLNSPAMAAQWAQAVERVDFSCPDAS